MLLKFLEYFQGTQIKEEKKMEQNELLELVTTQMPYGKYKGVLLCNMPEPYLAWYYEKGFPQGKIGHLLGLIYEIKLNGLEYLLKPLLK